jgi:hypothetical protein
MEVAYTTITADDLIELLKAGNPKLFLTDEGRFITGPIDLELLASSINMRVLNTPEEFPTKHIVPFLRFVSEEDHDGQ